MDRNIFKEIKKFKQELLQMIDSMPDAQSGVHHISKKPDIAIISFSHIQKNEGILCPHYYLNCEAKNALRATIKRTQIENLP